MKQKMFIASLLIFSGLFVVGHDSEAAVNDRAPMLKIYDAKTTQLEREFLAFPASFKNGGTVAVADLDGDGNDEIIVGAGPGGGPQVRIFNGDGQVIRSFFAYDQGLRSGINVAAGDLNNDGRAEIVTAPKQGGGPHVRVFTPMGRPIFPGFFVYATSFKGGVNVAVGDITGDGQAEIITGSGVGGSPHVRVFDRRGQYLNQDFRPFADRDRGGVSVAVANVDGGSEMELITSVHRFGRAQIKVYKTDGSERILGLFEGWPESFQGGLNVAGGDLDNDGVDEVLAAVSSGGGPQLRGFEASGRVLSQNFFPYESEFRGGVNVAVGDVDGDGRDEIVTLPGRNTVQGRTDLRKYIEVNLTEQRLYAFENGIVKNTFLISSGVAKYPTPEGQFSVTAKIPLKDYEWSYGENHPDNYDIKDVAHNLRFAPTYYLHSAFWHNAFGSRRSHGCVNISPANAAWIYQWADVGTTVIIHQ